MALYQIDSKKIQQEGETKLLWFYSPEAEVRLSLLETDISSFEIIWDNHYLLGDHQSLKYGTVQSEDRGPSFRPKTSDLIAIDGDLKQAQISEGRKFILQCEGLDQELIDLLLNYLDHRGRHSEMLKSSSPLSAYREYESSRLKKKMAKLGKWSFSLKALVLLSVLVSILVGLWLYRQSLYQVNPKKELISQEDYETQRWQRLCEEGDSRACLRLKPGGAENKLNTNIREDECRAGDKLVCFNLARERLRFSDSENQERALQYLRLSCQGPEDPGCELLKEREAFLELKVFCENQEGDRCLAAGELAEKFRLYSEARKFYRTGCDLGIEANCLALGSQLIKENNVSAGVTVLRESCVRGERNACFRLRLAQESSLEEREQLMEKARKCEEGEERACVVFLMPE